MLTRKEDVEHRGQLELEMQEALVNTGWSTANEERTSETVSSTDASPTRHHQGGTQKWQQTSRKL